MSLNSKSLFCIIFAFNCLKIIHSIHKWSQNREYSQRKIQQNLLSNDKSLNEKLEIVKPNGVKLLSLPNELLLSILDRVPIGNLVRTVPLVCSYFAQLSEAARTKRRSLSVIFNKLDATACPSFFSPSAFASKRLRRMHTIEFPKVDQLNAPICTRLASAFPGIRSLQLNALALTGSQLDCAVTGTLLAQWQTQLESLNLTFWFHDGKLISNPNLRYLPLESAVQISATLKRLIERRVNPMTKLRKFALISSVQFVPTDLSIIGQLSEFYFYCSGQSLSIIQDSLLKYGEPNRRLKYIGIGSKINGEDELRRTILPVNARISTFALTPSITSLQIDIMQFEFKQLDSFLLCLANLCGLTIVWPVARPLVELIDALVPVTNAPNSKLETLSLIISAQEFQQNMDTSQMDLSSIANGQIQLRTITKLYLNFNSSNHTDYRMFHFSRIFPQLEWFYTIDGLWSCSICGLKIQDFLQESPTYVTKRAGCVKWIVRYLKDTCPQVDKFIFTHISMTMIKREIHF